MQPVITTIPGYKINDYLIVLRPHQELWNKLMQVKNDFADNYDSEHARKTHPHIALVKFTQYEMMEEKIINRLKNIAMAQFPFKIELKDFGSYPSHTIYINVPTKVPFQSLVRSIRSETQRLMKLNPENKPHFMMDPHLTIARKLKPWQFEKGWLEYSHKNFTARFIASEMVLLKRGEDDVSRKYVTAGRFVFQNMPVTTKQGELFV